MLSGQDIVYMGMLNGQGWLNGQDIVYSDNAAYKRMDEEMRYINEELANVENCEGVGIGDNLRENPDNGDEKKDFN
eukprot:6254460-Alexandrium_andersonii.AAC.1